ncbi:unnamed protein product [Miscanthus lutarioriparius]|uniref:Uncharacterized protein n=1 Tax=Miscanthus lutarioriparius TaxID=422564 RepID=A0A811MDL8_9POAL|nr:unnamed protein product [Miscanthus lutarioriparius]
MGRTGENLLVACVVIHYLNIIVNLLSFYTDGEQARFWTLVSRIVQSLCYASTTLITCVFIRYYMRVDGEYHVTFRSAPAEPAAGNSSGAAPTAPSGDGHVLGLVRVCGVLLLSLFKAPLEIGRCFRLCDERINGKDQRAEKILLSLAPPAEAKTEDT